MAGNMVVGYICCLVAGLGFGSNYLPVKQVSVGDGVFFSACMAIGIMAVGILVNFTVAEDNYSLWPPHRPPKFEVFAAVGGGAWMLGNLACPVIVEWLGLGLGLAIWDCFNLLTGWATGNLGLFGVWKEDVASPALNYIGVALAMVSLVILAFATDEEQPEANAAGLPSEACASPVAPEVPDLEQPESPADGQASEVEVVAQPDGEETDAASVAEGSHAAEMADVMATTASMKHLGTGPSVVSTSCSSAGDGCADDDLESGSECGDDAPTQLSKIPEVADHISSAETPKPASRKAAAVTRAFAAMSASLRGLSPAQRRQAYGFLLAMLAGFLFGLTFDLPTDLMQLGRLGHDHSTNPMDYVFSHFCGIAVTAALALVGYLAARRGESYTPCNVVLPAIASGAMWAVAQVAWFQANVELSLSIAFPIISTLPGIVGMFWGYMLFGEFRSTRSRRLGLAGMALRVPAVALIALSAFDPEP